MNEAPSPNTRAILLLTAPLIAGGRGREAALLTAGEYRALAARLHSIQAEPADLLQPDADSLMDQCSAVVDKVRLAALLGRGLLLGDAVDHWRARAIWVVSRADGSYPRKLKERLKRDAPILLYGCGEIGIVDGGALAIVGSRDADEPLIRYTHGVAALAARAGRTVVSGGARGVDRAAMNGALEAGGRVAGVLAGDLERTTMHREHRNLLLEGRLVLLSSCDPRARFNVGHAMQRNKAIYALADAALVVDATANKGGTWAGAIEQLQKYRAVPVYVRSTGERSDGIDALQREGARPWPNPDDEDGMAEALDAPFHAEAPRSCQTGLFPSAQPESGGAVPPAAMEPEIRTSDVNGDSPQPNGDSPQPNGDSPQPNGDSPQPNGDSPQPNGESATNHAEEMYRAARPIMLRVLAEPKNTKAVAEETGVTDGTAKSWIRRLVEEGAVEKQTSPVRYVARQKTMFESP